MTYAALAHRETVDALRTVRELWGELLVAIETPPADVWPPRQLAHTLRPDVDGDELLVADRAPLVLREHPAPLNVTALDTGLAIERTLFDLADLLAAVTQQYTPLDHPRRWAFRADSGPGSRAYGLHWAALWIEGRVLNEDTEPELLPDGTLAAPPFTALPGHLLHEARRTARSAEGRLLRTLGLDARTVPIPDRACPWCGGELLLHRHPDVQPAVTCATGERCGAPVPLDERGRRRWGVHELVALASALDVGEWQDAARAA
ncbi:hypothetical protein [Streptomyces sp. Da 82-17]|uniref:hypothetical protein n=1 Tax=Streptomyces sp. Da 82-17 TaxID=3377116 RepID=UPI0038D48A12